MVRSVASLIILLAPSMAYMAGGAPRPAVATHTRAPAASMVALPGKAVLAGVAGVGVWLQRLKALEEKKERLASVEWSEAPTDSELESDACIVIGEEKEEGRTWFKCNEPSEGLECEEDVSIAGDGYVCKEPKR